MVDATEAARGAAPARHPVKVRAAGLLSGGGVAASLCLLACCALPPLLATIGLAGAWTLALQGFLGVHEQGLLRLTLAGLGSGAGAWLWQWCGIGTRCGSGTRPVLLMLTPLLPVIGASLAWLALHPT